MEESRLIMQKTKQEEHPEITKVAADAHNVSCDGGGALGHPKVWYSFEDKDEIICGYCDRLFTKK